MLESSAASWELITGWLGVMLFIIALYVAVAMLLEGVQMKEVLPKGAAAAVTALARNLTRRVWMARGPPYATRVSRRDRGSCSHHPRSLSVMSVPSRAWRVPPKTSRG